MTTRNLNAEEAQIAETTQQRHKFADIRVGGVMTITPPSRKKIRIQSWQFRGDSTMTSAMIAFASTGVDTVNYRGVTANANILNQGFPYFAADYDQPVTITLSGHSLGTYDELLVGYIEVG